MHMLEQLEVGSAGRHVEVGAGGFEMLCMRGLVGFRVRLHENDLTGLD